MVKLHRFRLPVLAVMLVAFGLALTSGHTAADGPGPRLALNASGTGVSCDAPSEPTECTVPLEGFFTLAAEVIEAPTAGYIAVQSFIDYGSDFYDPSLAEDEFGPGTCGNVLDDSNDGFPDRLDTDCVPAPLTYHSTGDPGEEIVWPDLGPSEVAFRGETAAAMVSHSGLSGLTPPLTVSTYVGPVVELVMSCSAEESTSDVKMLPIDDPFAAGLGTGFAEPDAAQVPSKPSTLTINCAGVAPQVTDDEPTSAPTATTAPPALPPTGTGGAVDGSGGNAVLLAAFVMMLAAAGAGLGFFGWRKARAGS